MIIYNEKDEVIDYSKVEAVEQSISEKYIQENDIVFELGARYGIVSCIINSKLNNKKNHVVVEPDDRVWNALEKNKQVNHCEFGIIKGFVSQYKLTLIDKDSYGGFGTTAMFDSNSTIPNFTMNDIYNKYALKFNVLFADCEGFLEIFLNENPSFYETCRLIVFEQDCPWKCNYELVKENLRKHNFKQCMDDFHQVWVKN